MDHDDHQVGRVLSRREVLALFGSAGAALLVGYLPGQAEASQLEVVASTMGGQASTVLAPTRAARLAPVEGRYVIDEQLNRSDIQLGKDGVPLQLTFRLSQVNNAFLPVAGAIIEIWHGDAMGKQTTHGYQLTGANGEARFTTVYPGWEEGRAVHINFKIRTDPAAEVGHEITSQLFFDDNVTDEVHSRQPYASHGQRTVRNSADPAYRNGGDELTLLLVRSGLGYAATYDVGLQLGEDDVVQAAATQASSLGCALTLSRTEGPYYTPGSPLRSDLIDAGMVGSRVIVTGYVYNSACQPIANAWVDFWQCDYYGVYDNVGYVLRGHQFTDATGMYRLRTIVPGEYPGRTVHIHVKVQAPGGPILTSQIFFPDVAHNASDGIYHSSLLVALENPVEGKTARFNFVVTAPSEARKPSAKSHMFRETGFTVSGRFWEVWQGGRAFEDSLYINGYPITEMRDEVSPIDGRIRKTQWFERARFELHPEKQAPDDVALANLGVAATQGRQGEAPFRPVPNPGGRAQWFARTGHTLGDFSKGGMSIITYWSQRGDVRQFGLPISEPFMEASGDGVSRLAQYFERQRFEYHPEYRGTRYEIQLSHLGSEQVKR